VPWPTLERALPDLGGRVDMLATPLIAISATDLRRRSAAGHSIRYQVPDAVEAYIAERGLYTE
jgi:nicotinate-nucleotide adenylyltransferase